MDTHTIYRVQALLQEAYELLDILYAQHPANLTPSTVVNPPAFNLDAMVETATAKVQDFINGQAYLAQRDIINACQEAMLKSNQRHDAYLVENFPAAYWIEIAQHEHYAAGVRVGTATVKESLTTGKQRLQVPTGWAAPKDQYAVPVLFNPYTGEPRDVRDVQSDPQGILIVPPGKVHQLAAMQGDRQ